MFDILSEGKCVCRHFQEHGPAFVLFFLEVFFVKVVTAVPMTHMGKPSNEGTVLRTQVILMQVME